MKEVKGNKKSAAQKIEDLLNTAKEEITEQDTKDMVDKLKIKLIERKKAARVLANIDREIEEMKLELAHEMESIE